MYGEFYKLTKQPDGRCIFVSSEEILLLYMNNGKQIEFSPEWHINLNTCTSRITSYFESENGNLIMKRAFIRPNGRTMTEHLEGETLVSRDNYVENSLLDHFFDNRTRENLKVGFFSRNHYCYWGERDRTGDIGRGIRYYTKYKARRSISIRNWGFRGEYSPGYFLYIYGHGEKFDLGLAVPIPGQKKLGAREIDYFLDGRRVVNHWDDYD